MYTFYMKLITSIWILQVWRNLHFDMIKSLEQNFKSDNVNSNDGKSNEWNMLFFNVSIAGHAMKMQFLVNKKFQGICALKCILLAYSYLFLIILKFFLQISRFFVFIAALSYPWTSTWYRYQPIVNDIKWIDTIVFCWCKLCLGHIFCLEKQWKFLKFLITEELWSIFVPRSFGSFQSHM